MIINTVSADLRTQETRASTAMVLTYAPRNIPDTAPDSRVGDVMEGNTPQQIWMMPIKLQHHADKKKCTEAVNTS